MLRDLARSRPLVRIRYHRNLALPRLSWLCEVWLPPTELIVHLGSWKLATRSSSKVSGTPISPRGRSSGRIAVHHHARWSTECALSIALRRQFRLPRLWDALDGSIYCFAVNKCVRDYRDALRREPHRPQRRRERAS